MSAYVVTYTTNTSMLLLLRLSLHLARTPLVVLPRNFAHAKSHWQKVYALTQLRHRFLATDVVLFADGHDTMVQQSPQTIHASYLAYVNEHGGNADTAIIFNGIGTRCFPYDLQRRAWPSNLLWHLNGTAFEGADACARFATLFPGPNHALNSGLVLGRAGVIQRFMERVWSLRLKPFYTDQSTVIAVAHVFGTVFVDSNNTLFARPWRHTFCDSWRAFPHRSVVAYHLTGLPTLRSRCWQLARASRAQLPFFPGTHT
ncbi:glycosyltransferase domain-containing protein [Nereida ignava]|uniref:glycosyltransferase domain-containing protein n=1 Tax=Nereida ignava TaxID=282199 RepID=UPI0030F8B6FA